MAYDVKYSPNRWKDEGDIVPGFGGIWPGDPDAETYHVSGNPARVTYRCRLLAPALSPPEGQWLLFERSKRGEHVYGKTIRDKQHSACKAEKTRRNKV